MDEILKKKIDSGRQYRAMQMAAGESVEDKAYRVSGYATTYNEQYSLYRDEDIEILEQVDPAAFEDCDMSDVIMQYDHHGRVFARTSNNTLSLSSDEHGLFIEADLSGTAEGRNLYEEIAGGYTTKMSFGFTVEEDRTETTENHETGRRTYLRTITKIGKLYDVSAVSLPANDGTEISARTFIDGVIAKDEAERLLKAENERKKKQLALKLKLMEA